MNLNKISTLSIVVIFTLAVLYFIFPKILYNFFVPSIIKDNKLYLFGDWSVIIAAVKCRLEKFDVFYNNPCDILNRKHVYGSILLFIPYFEKLNNFYLFYFPIFINLVFLILIASHFNFKYLKQIILYLLLIFNPSTLLLMERLNIDILIFLIMILLVYLRKDILNLLFIFILSIAKFYPISLLIMFFLNDKKLKVNILFSIILLTLTFYSLYLDLPNLLKIIKNVSQFSAAHVFSFSFLSLTKIPFLLNFFTKEFLIILSFLVFLPLFLFGYFLSKKNLIQDKIFLIWDYKRSLFLVSGSVLISCYFIFNNVYYREIFLFGLIPLSLELQFKYPFFKNLINFIIFKLFLFNIFYCFFLQSNLLLVFKQIINLLFLSFLFGLFLHLYLTLFKIKTQANNFI